MRPFFKFYGGKYQSAPKYPQPQHKRIVEPFAGSAGYAVRNHDRDVVLRDIDPVIVGVWRYLIGVSPGDMLALPDIPEGGTVDDIEVPQAARWLIGFWLNAGAASPRKRPSAWMRQRHRPRSFWGTTVRQRIASQVPHIRHWTVEHVGYADSDTSQAATWFVDPPYVKMGKHYKHSSNAIDYAHLGAWCRSLPGQTIVCEHAGADWLPFANAFDAPNMARKARTEVSWLSPSSSC